MSYIILIICILLKLNRKFNVKQLIILLKFKIKKVCQKPIINKYNPLRAVLFCKFIVRYFMTYIHTGYL